jgi:hypothetical protein
MEGETPSFCGRIEAALGLPLDHAAAVRRTGPRCVAQALLADDENTKERQKRRRKITALSRPEQRRRAQGQGSEHGSAAENSGKTQQQKEIGKSSDAFEKLQKTHRLTVLLLRRLAARRIEKKGSKYVWFGGGIIMGERGTGSERLEILWRLG